MRVRGKNNNYSIRTGSLTKTAIQEVGAVSKKKQVKEVKRRMRQISQIAAFREEKLKKEMDLLNYEQQEFERK